MSLGYSRGNPLQYIIQILNRVEALKYISPVEPENFELQTLSEDKTFFPNGVPKLQPLNPGGVPSIFLQIPQ